MRPKGLDQRKIDERVWQSIKKNGRDTIEGKRNREKEIEKQEETGFLREMENNETKGAWSEKDRWKSLIKYGERMRERK